MRRRSTLFIAAVVLLVSALPPANAVPTPVVAKNLELVVNIPDVGAISGAFDSTVPLFYVNTATGISIYDISNPELPLLKSELPLPHFENERMTLGERGATKFLLIGLDGGGVTPTKDPGKVNVLFTPELIIVDVSDPSNPAIRSRLPASTSTHTVHCVDDGCNHAYTSGDSNKFTIFDLTDLDAPKEVRPIAAASSGRGHQWDFDDADNIWHSGSGGVTGYDMADPLNPKAIAATNVDAVAGRSHYNNFIIHNSSHPYAESFTPDSPPSLDNGNVLLVTEEDYESPVCDGAEGSFSTWHIPYLDAARYAQEPGAGTPGNGRITPLDSWNSEILDSGVKTVAGAFCSAHYFTMNDAGFVAQAWYQQGTRILDVRDPTNIKQVGYFFTGQTETWIPYFVPERDASGMVTGRSTNLIYTNDVARGIDVLRFTPPETAPAQTGTLRAPILPEWLAAASVAAVKPSAPSATFGFACRIPTA